MDKATISENNKLIAEFMGWKERNLPVSFGGGEIWISQHKTSTFCSKIGEEMFHESYDWLMPVVEKIKTLVYKEDFKVKGSLGERIKCVQLYTNIFLTFKDCNIATTYKTVIEFIEWYNENNKK